MGSPISPIIANMVLSDIEHKVLQTLSNTNFLYQRYVDDIILSAKPENINNILNTFNSYHTRLQFTLENENKQNSITFLDMLLIRKQDGSLQSNWFTKPIHSGRYINFFSHTSKKYKISIINSLIDRAIKLSSPKFHNNNLLKVKSLLLLNDYPIVFINNYVNKRLHKIIYINKNNNPINSFDEFTLQPNCLGNEFNNCLPTPYISIPYIPIFSDNIQNKLSKFNI